MHKYLILFFITFLNYFSYSQAIIEISIIDSITNKSIELATVSINNQTYSYSNANGRFELEVYKLKASDTIKISKLGYQLESFLFKDIQTLSRQIFLKVKMIELDEVEFNIGKMKKFKLGNPVGFTINNFLLRFNDQVATYIPGDRFGYVKEIKFNISNDIKGIKMPFKLRLLKKGEDGMPETSLLDQDIIVNNPNGKSWIAVDLSAYKIPIPNEGMFVVFKVLSKEYYDDEIFYHGRYYYKIPSPALRAYKKNETSYTLILSKQQINTWNKIKRDVANLEVLMEE